MTRKDVETKIAIEGAKRLVKKRFRDFNSNHFSLFLKHTLMYLSTNENIDAYLNIYDITGKQNALSVLASGDQAFNLITKGIMNIDTFDINDLTEYFALGLKRAMILKYSYREYLVLMRRFSKSYALTHDELYSIIKGLFPYMEKHHMIFWNALIDFDYKLRNEDSKDHEDTNLIQLLTFSEWPGVIRKYDNFLLSEENYNLLKSKIHKANITYKHANAAKLSNSFDKKYDLILLSNILDYFMFIFCDYWGYEYLEKFESMIEKLASDDAILYLKYAFYYRYRDDERREDDSTRLFRNSCFSLNKFTDEEIHEVPNSAGYESMDGVVLKRIHK